MNKYRKYAKIIGVALSAALALGLIAFGGVAAASYAQTATPTAAAPTESALPFGLGGPRGHRGPGGDFGGLIDEATHQSILAEALGLSVDELQTALDAGQTPREIAAAQGLDAATFQANLETARNKVVDQLVAAGKLTQMQADAIKNHAQDKQDKGGPRGELGGLIDEATHQSILAEALGLSVDELQTALDAGQTPREIAAAQGLDAATFQANLETARNKVIDQLVTAGKLTQAQADAIKAHAANCPPDGRGPGGRHGGRGGFGPGEFLGNSQPPATSTTTP